MYDYGKLYGTQTFIICDDYSSLQIIDARNHIYDSNNNLIYTPTYGGELLTYSYAKIRYNGTLTFRVIGNDEYKEEVSENEIKYCESKNKMKYQHYAARFAAKEAIFKAVSKKIENKFDIGWKSCEIINDENGRPEVKILDKNLLIIKTIDISISHCKDYAVAVVVAEIE